MPEPIPNSQSKSIGALDSRVARCGGTPPPTLQGVSISDCIANSALSRLLNLRLQSRAAYHYSKTAVISSAAAMAIGPACEALQGEARSPVVGADFCAKHNQKQKIDNRTPTGMLAASKPRGGAQPMALMGHF